MNKPASEAHNTNALTLVKELWLGTCARYTVLCLILLLISAVIADSLTVTYVDTVRFILLLPLGLCLALAAWVRRSDKLSAGAKVGLHALATLGGFYLFGYLPYQIRTKPTGMQILFILLLAVILYAAAMGIFAAVTAGRRQKRVNDTPYESQFRKE